jgi:hypothetical protein
MGICSAARLELRPEPMTSELHSIARLAAPVRRAEQMMAKPVDRGRLDTDVQDAIDIAPFETVVIRAAAAQTQSTGQLPVASPVSAIPRGSPGSTAPSPVQGDIAKRAFEAFALQTFIGAMLPKQNSRIFGTGNAGNLWQGLLAEKLAEQVIASGRLKMLPQQSESAPVAIRPGSAGPPPHGSPATLQTGNRNFESSSGSPATMPQQAISSLKPEQIGENTYDVAAQ